jgi:hypothetical protein
MCMAKTVVGRKVARVAKLIGRCVAQILGRKVDLLVGRRVEKLGRKTDS